MIRVGINGFGRIGRSVFRILASRPDVQVVGINDLFDAERLAYLLRYDTVQGVFDQEVEVTGNGLRVGGRQIRLSAERDPSQLPWSELGVDIAVESTGVFRTRAQVAQHLEAGASRVVLTVPAKDEIDAMIVLGVNDGDLGPEHRVVSNASCTTNCLAPLAKTLDDAFGFEEGFITTIHAYTNGQRLVDSPHSDPRRSRSATANIIPTTTGAARAVGKVLPHLNGRLDGDGDAGAGGGRLDRRSDLQAPRRRRGGGRERGGFGGGSVEPGGHPPVLRRPSGFERHPRQSPFVDLRRAADPGHTGRGRRRIRPRRVVV